jgi:hypothetical protein
MDKAEKIYGKFKQVTALTTNHKIMQLTDRRKYRTTDLDPEGVLR